MSGNRNHHLPSRGRTRGRGRRNRGRGRGVVRIATSSPTPSLCSHGAGLFNFGNTCFLNAILQCFTHTVPLVKALRSHSHSLPCERGIDGFCVLDALRDLIERSLASSGKIIAPQNLFDNLSCISSFFRRYQQEDAHEFLQCLLDRLERCCLEPNPAEDSSSSDANNIVKQIFGGRLVSKLKCCSCGHFSDKYEPLIDLSLEIEEVGNLHDAFESFTKVERMEDSEAKLTCDGCKEKVSMEKQLMLDRAPLIATLHLKRFKSDGYSVDKIGKHVEFPLQLDLTPYSNHDEDSNVSLKYQLYGVVVHNGWLPTSGHYFCYIRSSPGKWHKLDDTKIYDYREEYVLSQSAYILFYARDGTPWFSSLMESQKFNEDLGSLNTSPKSVLQTVEGDDGIVADAADEVMEPGSSKKGAMDPGKMEAIRYINKRMPSSRQDQLLSSLNDTSSNEKKEGLSSSSRCKRSRSPTTDSCFVWWQQ